MFSGASNVDSYASGKEVVSVKLPSVSSTKGSQAEDSDKPIVNTLQSKDTASFYSLDQQIPDLVTLSLLPRSQWQSLINLDIIKVFIRLSFISIHFAPIHLVGHLIVKKCLVSVLFISNFQVRNKPVEPPKKPEKAPFFLPSIPSLSGDILFKPNESTNDEAKKDQVESLGGKSDTSLSQFLQVLHSSAEMKNCKYTTSSFVRLCHFFNNGELKDFLMVVKGSFKTCW